MRKRHLRVLLAAVIFILFISTSFFLILEKNSIKSIQRISYVTENPIITVSAEENIGVLIKTDEKNLDNVAKIVQSKGVAANKYRVGRVVAANIHSKDLDSLSKEESITQITPNRFVQAFEVNEVSETNAENFWNSGYTGKNVVVAVLDSGISSNHNDKIIASEEFVGSSTAEDENGHGTKVAEIILAMAPDVKLINAKVLDKNNLGSEASVIAGINYAVEQKANIISLSLGGLFDDINSPLVAAVEDATSKGITVVVASGNCGKCGKCNSFSGVATPGNSPNAITVGSVNGENEVCYSAGKDYKNYIKPDITAPENANSLSGTSASTPFVTGAAALVIEKYNAKPSQIKYLLENNAKDLGTTGKDAVFGSGKLNLNFLNSELPEENKITTPKTPESPVYENRNVVGFDSLPVNTTENQMWNILNLGGNNTFNSKYTFDVLNDDFIMIGSADTVMCTNCSSTLSIWNGTTWIRNNVTEVETIQDIKIYNRSFALAGGNNGGMMNVPFVYLWNGNNFTRQNFSNILQSKIIKVFVKSPSEAYALETNGRIFKYSGSTWTTLSATFGTTDYGQTMAADILDGNNMMIAHSKYNANPFSIYHYDGSWTDTSVPIEVQNCTNLTKIQMIDQNNAYIACNKTLLKWNGASWNIAYTSQYDITDFSFVDRNFGFITAKNRTIIKWDGYSFIPKQYNGENVYFDWSANSTDFDFIKINMIDRNEGYTFGMYYLPAAHEGVLNTNWIWNGDEWLSYSPNMITPLPTGAQSNPVHPKDLNFTLRASPWKTINANGETYALAYDDVQVLAPSYFGYDSRVGTNAMLLKLKKSLTINIPSQSIAVGGTKIINLSNYAVSNKTILNYAVVQENTSQVDCIATGTMLTMTGNAGFNGISLCKIKAQTAEQEKITDVNIYVGIIPPQLDIFVNPNDITFDGSGHPVVMIHSVSGGSLIDMNVTLIEVDANSIKKKQTTRISSFNTSNETNLFTSSTFNATRGNDVVVIVDSDNEITEYDKLNNKAKNSYKRSDVYLNFTIEDSFKQVMRDYLQIELRNYNVITDPVQAKNIVNIGYDLKTNNTGCSKCNVQANGESYNLPYTGVIFTQFVSSKTITNVCGARIEGIVNAVKSLDKNELGNNNLVLFDKFNTAALSTFDFMKKSQSTVDADLVRRALYGGLSEQDNIVRTADGILLRLRNYKPVASQSFLDYLFNVNNSRPWLKPVIMAGGLWSDITAWDEAGKEIASGIQTGIMGNSLSYAPRDVWLIELTGGPGIECDTCKDYTYEDVYQKYWPTLVGGVLKLSGKDEAAYVGHSNGGRIALDAMGNYTSLIAGKNVGQLSNGTSIIMPSSNPITTYIGVGVPGAFNTESHLRNIMLSIAKATNTNLDLKKHISFSDILGFTRETASETSSLKISVNLWKKYFDFMNLTTDPQPGIGVNLAKTLMIAGTLFGTNDEIVPVDDVDTIYSNITVKTGSQNKKVLTHMWKGHMGMTEDSSIGTIVKQFLNDEQPTCKIINQVNGT